jgi:flagellar basal body L-ring protein FlgH
MSARERDLFRRCLALMAGSLFFFLLAAARAYSGDFYSQYATPDNYDHDARFDVISSDDEDLSYAVQREIYGNRPVYFRQKASRVHDSVTIIVDEETASEITSSNDLKRDTSNSTTLTSWLTPSLTGGLGATQHGAAAGGSTPTFAWSGARAHKSDSTIERAQTFTTTLTGEVLAVLTNGYLVVQARKRVNVNGEQQTVMVTGIVNPDHMDSNSAVRAEYLMDMSVDYSGNGPMTRMDKRGWWGKAFDFLNPF